ncbi:MAG TPA: VWA domain-containing protein [Anaerolineae bacterium]|nr:VWA domain-containing protein [Anaerolineae bacterium]
MKILKLSGMALLGLSMVGVLNAQTEGAQAKLFGFDAGNFPEVRAFVSVTDAEGKPIQALPIESFKIQEDGKDARIIRINTNTEPIHVGLLIDHSGSMSGGKLEAAKSAAEAFVEQMRLNDEAFVMQFDDTNQRLTDFTTDHATLTNAIGTLQIAGGTAFYDATYIATDQFQTREKVRKKALIVLTDGEDNREVLFGVLGGSQHTLDEAIAHARQAGVIVYTIGLGSDADRARLQQLAQQTDGRAYFAPSGQELRDLYLLIAEQLQKDYALDFQSPRPAKDGTRRTIQLTVTLPSGETQTVTGVYVAGYLFNRIRTDWVVGGLLGLLLVGLAATPRAVQLLMSRPRAPAPTLSAPSPPTAHAQPMPLTCPNCGAAIRPGARFCGNCRYDLTQAAPRAVTPRQCPNCGQPVREGAKFCGNCRYRLG